MEELYNGIVRLSDHASVQSMDNAIHRINLCLVDSALRFFHSYPLDRDLSVGYTTGPSLYTTGLKWLVCPTRDCLTIKSIFSW